jgi:hypothetical protein
VPNPTLAWTFSGPHSFTIAGANPTVAEVMTALNTLITANATLWSVSDYSAGNGTIEIKRAGSPTGELATVRILIMGGQAPHANALAGAHSAGATTGIYGALSVDANTTGPSSSYASAAPYASKYTRAGLFCTPSTGLTAASSPRITLIESADAFGVVIGDTTNMHSFVAGRIVVRASDDSLVWASMPSGGAWTLVSVGTSMSITVAHPITPLSTATNTVKATYWDTVTAAARQFGRIIAPTTATLETALGASGSPACILPVPVGESAQATSQTPTFLGFLRQIRLGPIAQHRIQLRDGSNVLQATHMFSGSATGIGMWMDEVI